MIAEEENHFWTDCEKRYFSVKLSKDTFEWVNLNEIEHSNFTTSNTKICLYVFCFSAKSSAVKTYI